MTVPGWACAALLWCAAAVAADPDGLPEYPKSAVDVPVALVLNGEPRGDVFAKAADDGDILVRPTALTAAGVHVRGGSQYRIGAGTWLSLRSITGATVELDEKTLVLALSLPPDWFDAQRKDLSTRASVEGARTEDRSAFVNYRLAHTSADAASATSLATELAGRRGPYLARTESMVLHGSETGSQFLRFQTQLLHDNRDTAERWTFGDSFASSGELGSTLALGGVSYAKEYQMTPYFMRYPSATFSGVAAQPSDVEVYVGGTRVYRDHLPPGAFELRDFSYYGGRQDVQVLVRDALGQVQSYEYPYYFSDQSLAPGVQEYRYGAGMLRENYGQPSGDRYRGFAASAVHRYGYSELLTLGGRAEVGGQRANLGPVATLRFDRWGSVGLGASLSRDGDSGETGSAGSLAYTFRDQQFNARAAWRELSPSYAVADPLAASSLLLREALAGVGYGTSWTGNFDLQAAQTRYRNQPVMRWVQFSYSRTLFGRASAFAQVRRILSEPTETDAVAGLSVTLGPLQNLSAFHTATATSTSDVVQAGSAAGPREGFGYRLTAERATQEGAGASTRYNPYGEYNARFATFTVENRSDQPEIGEATSSWEAGVQGSFDWVENSWGFSRRVTDSFALARITPPLEGVRVYHNSQEIGRTDARGELLIPGVASFLDNPVAIEDKDVPIDFSLTGVSRTISPPFRSGSVVEFKARRTVGLVGRLQAATPKGPVPLEYYQASLLADGRSVEFPTGADGEFYLEDLAPGPHEGSVKVQDRECRFSFVVPDKPGPLVELDQVVVCETPR